jgi:hypothetical protein
MITDRRPHQTQAGHHGFTWTRHYPVNSTIPEVVPISIFENMTEDLGTNRNGKVYESNFVAMLSLAKACIAWAKSQVSGG